MICTRTPIASAVKRRIIKKRKQKTAQGKQGRKTRKCGAFENKHLHFWHKKQQSRKIGSALMVYFVIEFCNRQQYSICMKIGKLLPFALGRAWTRPSRFCFDQSSEDFFSVTAGFSVRMATGAFSTEGVTEPEGDTGVAEAAGALFGTSFAWVSGAVLGT